MHDRLAKYINVRQCQAATVMSKMLYCSPAWSGLCLATDIARLDAFVCRSKKLGYCHPETPAVAELFEKAV